MADRTGTNGPDELDGTIFADTISGLGGDDDIRGQSGADTLRGDGGNDEIFGENGDDRLFGGADDDELFGGDDDDTLNGEGENDVLDGGEGDDNLNGGSGNDQLDGGEGADDLDGGAGAEDEARYVASSAGVRINLAASTASGGDAQGDTLRNIEDVIGSRLNDTLDGDDEENFLFGGDGVDIVRGHDGDDRVGGGKGADVIEGGEGRDQITYFASVAGVTIRLFNQTASGGDATGDTISGIEDVVGSFFFADTLIGDAQKNFLAGFGGNDSLSGGGNDDNLNGGDQDDFMTGGTGGDIINGGNDIDTASYSGSAAGVTVNLLTGTGSGGDAQGDTLLNIENLDGSNGNDTLTGNDFANTIDGGDGADRLDGGAGIDTLLYRFSAAVTIRLDQGTASRGDAEGDIVSGFENVTGSFGNDALTGDDQANVLNGGLGNDTVSGGNGDDRLIGGFGNDKLRGGGGGDRYAGEDLGGFSNDTISDAGGADTLEFAELADFASSLRSGDDLIISLQQGGSIRIIDHFLAANRIEFAEIDGLQFVLATGNIGGSTGGIISGTDEGEVIDGRGDGDILFGNGGRDCILGVDGDDIIHDGDGRDKMSGGSGRDAFHLVSDGDGDKITDFTAGEDTIVFDRASFGLAADAEIGDLIHFGKPRGGLKSAEDGFYVMHDGRIIFVDGGEKEMVARIKGDLDGLSTGDFGLA